VVERSDTTGRMPPPTLHPEGVPETFLIRPARIVFAPKLKAGFVHENYGNNRFPAGFFSALLVFVAQAMSC
jgi:hypothetical protein